MAALAEPIIRTFAEMAQPGFLLEVILKVTFLLVLALLADRMRRGASASARHLVLGLAFGGTLLLPLLVFVAPSWEVAPLPALDTEWRFDNTIPMQLTSPDAGESTAGIAAQSTATTEPAAASHYFNPATWLACLWIAGATLVSLRLFIAVLLVGRILRRAVPVSEQRLLTVLQRCRMTLAVNRRIPLRVSDRAEVPFTWGSLRPSIILPGDCRSWSERKLEIVLLHEMAHIKRWDTFSTWLAQMVVIAYWFNPLVWLARRQLLIERERASDDHVLATGIKASEYAGCLVEIARVVKGHNWLPELQVSLARKTNLEERIMAIVTGHRRQTRDTRLRTVLVGLSVSLLLILPLAGFQIFAQDDHDPAEVTSVPAKAGVPATQAEMDEANAVLNGLHEALYSGDDFADIRNRYLSAGYFDEPQRTFENWPRNRHDELLKNTLAHFRARGGVPENEKPATPTIKSTDLVYRAETVDCRNHEGEFHLTRRVNITSAEPAASRMYLVRDLVQTIVFTRENGALRISRYDGGINIQRMDIDNPHGPIFIVTLDHHEQSIPTGPLLFKSVPRSIVPDNLSMIPLRTDATKR